MIRPQIANAVLMSVLFATLAGGAMLLLVGGPTLSHHVAAVVHGCELGARAMFGGS